MNEIVFLHVIRQLARTVNTNAMYKLLKIKLLFWLRTQYSNSMEQRYFQTMYVFIYKSEKHSFLTLLFLHLLLSCMTVITIQSIINVIFWFILWQLSKIGITGRIIQNLLFCSTVLMTLITQLFALVITNDYLRQIKPINIRLTMHHIQFNNMHLTQRQKIVTLKEIETKLDSDRMEIRFTNIINNYEHNRNYLQNFQFPLILSIR